MILKRTVYAVSERRPDIDDESWYEYEVELQNDEKETLDRWDSFTETYNGVVGQRLSRKSAEQAVKEIEQDVNAGEADVWFNIEE